MKSIVQNNENMTNSFESFRSFKCDMCGESDTKYCKDCYKNLCIKCVDNERNVNFVIRKHDICVECNDKICCYKKICYKCDIIPCHMITETIGVGSCSSKYEDFDVILNANFPENEVKENEISIQKIKDKIVIHAGLIDNIDREKIALEYMKKIIPVIYKLYKGKKILFHCFAGISRSAMFAVAYLSYSLKVSIEEAHNIVKNKRRFIDINKGFIRSLKDFNHWSNSSI